jgi:Tol biopolymer transport system component
MAPGVTAVRALRGVPAFSLAHWSDGDHIVLLTDAQEQGNLLWVELGSGNQGSLARTGDANGAVLPTFSHDGQTIVYVSTPRSSIHDGRLRNAPSDLFVVPYGARAGGTAMALAGASDPNTMEWYPALSPDDRYVAYTAASAPMGTTPMADSNYSSELFVIPVTGGQSMRLAANDAPACVGQHSPGIMNDWSKWSPQATLAGNGKTYYWLVFSSKRSGSSQLYITALTQNGELGGLSSYPALYLWNQPSGQSNHTPSWDNYVIPPVP